MAKAKSNQKPPETEENEISLEEAFSELNETIGKLESQDITLEEAFQEYKKGMELLKACNDTIDKVEKKVLVIDESGKLNGF
ncbi:MAG: exodeoxyribonuclease VII small subunit [Lachnospiraceae bacterium]|nr:exodeoxyribonuclease VII small subunit [Lachnospiraceae bacterium]